MASHGECKTCEHYTEGYCLSLNERISISRNMCHPGLIIRPVSCNHLQYYHRKTEVEHGEWMTGLGRDDD